MLRLKLLENGHVVDRYKVDLVRVFKYVNLNPSVDRRM